MRTKTELLARASRGIAGGIAALGFGVACALLPVATHAQTQPAQQQKQPAQQQKPPAQSQQKPAQKQPEKPATPEQVKANKDAETSAWVKLCEKAKIKKGEKTEELDICLTHHERIDGTSGQVIVSAALREVSGQDKKHLMVMVPLGVALPAGMQIKIDEDKEPLKLIYTICHPGGCTAEVEATPELVAKLKKGKQMMVAAMNIAAKPIFMPVPLEGFERTIAGAPVDPKLYAEARGRAMQEIIERQKALYDAAVKDAQAKQQQAPTQPATQQKPPPAKKP